MSMLLLAKTLTLDIMSKADGMRITFWWLPFPETGATGIGPVDSFS
jgi:hypothetical protein